MFSPQQLKQDLLTIVGANFVITGNELRATRLTSEQYHLFDRACGKSNLRMVIGDPSFIALDDVTDEAAAAIHALATEEPARVARLETAQSRLGQIGGLQFQFDTGKKILLSPGPAGNRMPSMLTNLSKDNAIEIGYISDGRGDAIAILDVVPELLEQRLRALTRIIQQPINRPGTPERPSGENNLGS
jgi:hypothetical protein